MRQIPFLETPLILAPIAGPGTPELTAGAINAGAFGFLASAYSDAARMRDEIERVRRLTPKPFGVNLFVDPVLPPPHEERIHMANERLKPYREALGIPHGTGTAKPPQRYREQLAVILEMRPRAFSFTFGIPAPEDMTALKAAGIYTIGTATSVEEALALERAGVDAICAQGAEAGGHRGSFIDVDRPPLIGTLALVPLVVDAVRVPVIAAGGIADGRGVAAVLALGACAAQLGTAFLRASEAQTSPAYRSALTSASASDTVVTKAFSGKSARGIANRMTRELSTSDSHAPYPYQNALTRDIRDAAAKSGDADFLSLWAGQAFPLIREEPVEAIVKRIVNETSDALESARTALHP